MGKLKKVGLVVGVLLLLLLCWAGYLFVASGGLKDIEPHFAGSCTVVSGVVGAEDITIHPSGTLAYVSSDDRRAFLAGTPSPGTIFAYSLDGPAPGKLVDLSAKPMAGFHPHGISLLARPGLPDRLFVVSHAGDSAAMPDLPGLPRHSVHLFNVVNGRLQLVKTIVDSALVSPNDIAAVGPEQFYVTMDHGSGTLAGHMFEDYLRLARSSVLFYDGETFTTVAEGFRYANGVALSRDKKQVYVAATTDGNVLIYNRNPANGALTLQQTVDTDTGVDNIELDRAGNLWIGAHPKLLAFVAHAEDADKKSPSQVLKLTRGPNGRFSPSEVMLSAGHDLSGSSVAAPFGRRLLVGGVFDPKFLDCTLNP